METYTPTVVEHAKHGPIYGNVLVELRLCPECEKLMLEIPRDSRKWNDTFPHYNKLNIEAQMKAAGWVIRGTATNADDDRICVECEAAGKANFICDNCKEKRPSSQIHDSFGDPPDYLCEPCFETVPAKQWAKIVEDLNESHRYEFC